MVKKVVKSKITPIVISMIMVLTALILSFNVVNARSGFIKKNVAWENVASKIYMDEHDYPYEGVHVNAVPGAPGSVYSQMQAAAVHSVSLNMLYGTSRKLVSYYGELPFEQTHKNDGSALDGWSGYYAEDKTDMLNNTNPDYKGNYNVSVSDYWGNNIDSGAFANENFVNKATAEKINEPEVKSLRLYAMSQASTSWFSNLLYTIVNGFAGICTAIVSIIVKAKNLDMQFILETLHLTGTPSEPGMADILTKQFIFDPNNNGSGIAFSPLMGVCLIMFIFAIVGYVIRYVKGAEKTKGLWSIIGNLLFGAIIIGICLTGQLGNLGQTFANGATKILDVTVNTINGGGGEAFKVEIDDDDNQNQVTQLKEIAMIYKPYIDIQICTQFDVNDITDLDFSEFGDNGGAAASSHLVGFTNAADFDNNLGYYYWFANSSAVEKTQNNRTLPTTNAAAAEKKLNSMITYLQNRYNTGTNQSQIKTIIDSFADPHGFSGAGLMFLFAAVMILLGLVLLKYAINVLIAKLEIFISLLGLTLAGPLIISNKKKMVETGKAIIGMLLVSFIEVTVWSIFFDLIIYATAVIIGATAGRLLITIAFLLLFLKFNPYIAQKIKSFMDKSTNAMCPAFHQARNRAKQKIRQYTRDKAREYGDSEKVVGYDKDGNAITEKRKGTLAHKMMLAAANSLEDPNQRKTLAKINSEGNKERDQQRARSTAELRRDAERRVDEIEQNIAADAQNDQNMISARAKRIREEAAEYDDNGNFIGYNMSKLTDNERAAIQDLKTLEDEERMLTGDKRYKDLLERQRYIDDHNKHLAEGEEPLAMSDEELEELKDYQDRLAQVREDIETKRTEINDEIANRSKIQAAEENGYKISVEDGQDLDEAIADATTIHAQEAHYKEYSDALEAAIDAHAEDVDNPQHQNGSSKLGSKIGTKVNREAVESQAAAELRLKQLKDGKRVANRATAAAKVKGIGEIVDREQRSVVGKAAEGLQNVGEVSADARAEDKSRRKLARKVARAESGKVLPGVATSALVSSIVNHDIDSRTVTQIDNDKFSEARTKRKAVEAEAEQKANELIANANGVDVATAAANIVADAEAENAAKKPAAVTKPNESGKISATDDDVTAMSDDNAEPQVATATASAPAPTPVPTAKTAGNLANDAENDVTAGATVNGSPTPNTSKISATTDPTADPTAEPDVVSNAEPVTQNGDAVNIQNGTPAANPTMNKPGASKITSSADATVTNDAVTAENATGKSSTIVNGQPVTQPTGQAAGQVNDPNAQVTPGHVSQTAETAAPTSGKRFGRKQKAPAPITRKDPITGRVTTVIPNAESAAGVATAATAAAVIANADHRNANAQQTAQPTTKPNTSRIAQPNAQQSGQTNAQQTTSPMNQPNAQAAPTANAPTADAHKSAPVVNTSSTPQTKLNSSKVNADNVTAGDTAHTVTAKPIPDAVPTDAPSAGDKRTSARQVSQPVADQNAPQSAVQNTPVDSAQTMPHDTTQTVSTPSTASQPKVKLNSTPQPAVADNAQAPVTAQSPQSSATTGSAHTAADVIRRQENIANAKAQPSATQPVNGNAEQSVPNTQSAPSYTTKPNVQPNAQPSVQPSAQPQTSNIAHNNPINQPTVSQSAQPAATKPVTAPQPKPSTVSSVAAAAVVDNTRNAAPTAPTSQTGNADSRASEPHKTSTIHINPTKPQTNASTQSVPTSQPTNGSHQTVDRAQSAPTTSTPAAEKSPTIVPDTSAPRQTVKTSGTQAHIDTPQSQSVAKPEAKPTAQPTSNATHVDQPTATRPNTATAAEAIIAAKSAQRAQTADNAASKPDTSTTQHTDVKQPTQNTAPKSPVRQEPAKPEPARHEAPKSEPKTVSAPHTAESSVTPKNTVPESATKTAPTPAPAPASQQPRQSASTQPTTAKSSTTSPHVDNRTASQPAPKTEPVKPATTQQPADPKPTTTDKRANTQPKQTQQPQQQNPQPARKAENVSTSAPRQPQSQSVSQPQQQSQSKPSAQPQPQQSQPKPSTQPQPQQQSQVKQNQTVSAAEAIIAAKSASQAQQNTNKSSTSAPTPSQPASTQAKPSNAAPTPTPAPAPAPAPAPSKPQPQQTSAPTRPQTPTPAQPKPQSQPATQQTRPEPATSKRTTDSSTTAPKQPIRQDTSAPATRQNAAPAPKSQPTTQQTTTQNPAPAPTPTKPQPQPAPAPAPAPTKPQPAPAPAPQPQQAPAQPAQQQAPAQQPAAAPRIKLTSKSTDAELQRQAQKMVEATQAAERAAAAEAARKQAAAAVELKRQKEAEAKRFSSEKHDAAKERKVAQIMEKQAKAQAKAAEKAAKRAQKDAEKAAKRASKMVTSEVAHETARREQALEEAARAARVDRAKATNDRIAHEASERSKDIIAQREQLSAAKQAVGLERRESKSPVSEQDVIANIASDTEALNDMVAKHGDEE